MMLDDSEDEGQEQALFVDEKDIGDDDVGGPPMSGMDYIRRVRQEAKGCPKVVVADIDTKIFRDQQTIKVTEPSGLLPVPSAFRAPMHWQRTQVAQFAQLRQKLIRLKSLVKKKEISVPDHGLPSAADAENWCKLCFGRLKTKAQKQAAMSMNSDQIENEEEVFSEDNNGTPPLLSIIVQMNQQQVESVLEYHINWLEATGFSSGQGRWLYSLLANLQRPLTPEMCSWLRRLSRLCSNIRASLDNSDDPRLQELNLIICLVSRYFEQRDLADS